MDRSKIRGRMTWLAQAAPGAFRDDAVFRGATIGAAIALLFLVARLGGRPGVVFSTPLPPSQVRVTYGDGGAQSSPPAAASPGLIAPSRSLQGLQVTPDARAQPDTFGRLVANQSRRKDPNASP